jgi:hypothetical protein
MKDFHRRRRAFRLDPCDVDRDVAFRAQLREDVVADEQLSR